MTVTSSTAKVSYAGNGSTTVFTVTFRFLVNSHVVATLRDANGAETTWVEGTHYTLTGAGGVSGTLTVNTSPTDYTPASGETLVISRNVPRTQETDYGENDSFPAETHEQALDKLTMLAQQQDEATARSLVVPLSDTAADISLPIDSLRASKFLAFDASGQPIAAAGTTSDFQPVSAFIDTLLDDADAATARTTLGAVGLTGDETIADIKTFGDQVRLSKGTDIASAATLVIPDDGNFFDVTGNTGPITAITVKAGTPFWLRCISTPQFNHNGTSLIMPADENRTMQAGDVLECFALADDEVIVLNILRANGFPLKEGLLGWGWSVATSSSTGTTTIPDDNTIPQSTEGNEVRTINYTPVRSDSTLFIDAWWSGVHGVNAVEMWLCLFLDSESDARRVASNPTGNGAQASFMTLKHHHTGHSAGVQHTWKLRVGTASAGTLYTNRIEASDITGGRLSTGLRITEMGI